MTSDSPPPPFPSPDHDHAACVAHGLTVAETRCARQGARLTPMRKRVLELLLAEGHRAVGAYDLLDRLAEDEARSGGKRPAPPVVYRALDFLVEHGLAHRLASVNAFIGCVRPDAAHHPQFLICRECRAVAELDADALRRDLGVAAEAAGFALLDAMVEVDGLCPRCRAVSSVPDTVSA